MPKSLRILIPNATGPNAGDQAILHNTIALLKKAYPKILLTIHSTDPKCYQGKYRALLKPTLYMWTAFLKKNPVHQTIRFLILALAYVSTKYRIPLILSSELRNLLNDYQSADIIVFTGGGYFRSKKGITQTVNLFMTVLMFQFAKLYNKPRMIAPMSFGPFASTWQEGYIARRIQGFNAIGLRESYSYQILRRYKIKNLILSQDIALLQPVKSKSRKEREQFTLGFTIRNWMTSEKQTFLEKSYIDAMTKFSQKTGSIIQPIVQVDDNDYGDRDRTIANRIRDALRQKHVPVKEIVVVSDFHKDITVYGKIDLLLGMRMHSMIFAAVHNIPFIPISYEYKTDGLAHTLGIDDYLINCEKVTPHKLYERLIKAYEDREKLIRLVQQRLSEIKDDEEARWIRILKSYSFIPQLSSTNSYNAFLPSMPKQLPVDKKISYLKDLKS